MLCYIASFAPLFLISALFFPWRFRDEERLEQGVKATAAGTIEESSVLVDYNEDT